MIITGGGKSEKREVGEEQGGSHVPNIQYIYLYGKIKAQNVKKKGHCYY